MNIYKNLMFLQGHFTDPHMDDAHEAAEAGPTTPPPAPRPWWQRWSRFGTAAPLDADRADACCQC